MALQNYKCLTPFLFMVIFLEGYIVLATELLAIRQAMPYIGSGADTVSIIIAAVLMPLAFGYAAGGKFKQQQKDGRITPLRKKLIRNLFIASCFLIPGLSYLGIDIFFAHILEWGITNRIILVSLYAALFLVTPVYLLGQTVPLVSNYFSARKLSQITGKILFVSTAGSFMGSVVSTIILIHYLGVNNTANVVVILLTLLVCLLCRRKDKELPLTMLAMMSCMLFVNSTAYQKQMHIVTSNTYNTIAVLEDDKGRYLVMNRSLSSMLGNKSEKFPYVNYVEQHYLEPIMGKERGPKNILVVGAAGFTFGLEDKKNNYLFVDIDPAIRRVAENNFLKRKLDPNKHFIGEDIRAFMASNKQKFDLIFLDAYTSRMIVPESLLTQDFFRQMKGAIANNGILVANFILSPNINEPYSQRLDTTFRSVFPQSSRQIIDAGFDGWSNDPTDVSNIIYAYHNYTDADTTNLYTDNHNTASYDRPNEKNKILGSSSIGK